MDKLEAASADTMRSTIHQEFLRGFGEQPVAGRRILEIGCAGAVWLPYLRRYFGLEVCGIDYSEAGGTKSREVLVRDHTAGEIICADLFHPPHQLVAAFDYVLSFGVIEHFTDSAAAVTACAHTVKPGGTLITFIPNMASAAGTLWQLVDRAVYDINVPLDEASLERAHHHAGLVNQSTRYLASTCYSVANLNKARGPLRRARRAVWLAAAAASVGIWTIVSATRSQFRQRDSSRR